MSKTFEEYLTERGVVTDPLRHIWNHQQQKIESYIKKLQAERDKVALLRGAVDRINWEFSQCYGMDNPEAFQNRRIKTYILELKEALEKLKESEGEE